MKRKANEFDECIIITKKRKKRKKNEETKNHCSICLEPLNSSGYHQICSLRCGHIFGRKCIERTIKKSQLCPICKTKASTSQIRNLFCTNISVRDTGEYALCFVVFVCSSHPISSRDNWVKKYENLMQRLNKEMMKTHQMQTQSAKLKAKNHRLEETNKILTRELVKMKRKYHNEQNEKIDLLTQQQPLFEHTTMPWNVFRYESKAKLKDNKEENSITNRIGIPIKMNFFQKIACCNANVFEFDASAQSVYYSYSQNCSFYGIKCSSLINEINYGNIQRIHSKKINDIKFRHRTQTELLSVSDDKTMAISDIRSNQKKYYYSLSDRANACLWSSNYEHCMYAVCSDGSINVMDIRRNHQKNYCLFLNEERVSLQNIAYCASKKLIISSKSKIFVLREDDFKHFVNVKNIKCKPFICSSSHQEQIIFSSHYNKQCDSVLLSYGDNVCITSMEDTNRPIKIEFNGPSTSSMSLFCCGQGSSNKYICYSDAKQRLNVISSNFNNNNDYRFKSIVHEFDNSICRDIKAFNDNVIGALCSDYLLLYKFERD